MIIPNWVKSFDEWNIYISDQGMNCGHSKIANQRKLKHEGGLIQHVDAGEKDLFGNLAHEIKVTNGTVIQIHTSKFKMSQVSKSPMERLYKTHTSKFKMSQVASKQNLMVMLPCLTCVAMI